ncbi:MAG: ABC transporter ATP-binding protein [Spirochaetaceae bacterium]|nr:ABC transporter ATP-binding protein [Spirochaetaceae bacterium]
MSVCKNWSGISIQDLYLRRGSHQIFSGFSLELEAGRVTALLGASGAGKTSLLDCLAGLLPVDRGTIRGVGPVSYLFQEPRLLPWYTLERNIMLPMESLLGTKAALERARHFLDLVELGEKATSLPSQCSGGQRQRCALARAFAYPSSTLLMDEAFQAQDIKLKLRLMELTEELLGAGQCGGQNQPPRTTVLVTHDVDEALALAHRVLVLSGSPLQVVGDFPGAGKELPMAGRYISPDQATQKHRAEILSLLCR